MKYKLTYEQRTWLRNVVNHRYKDFWVDQNKNEEEDILKILEAGEYDEIQKSFLTEFVDYYVSQIGVCGTLKKPIADEY